MCFVVVTMPNLEWDERLEAVMKTLSDKKWHDVEEIRKDLRLPKERGENIAESFGEANVIEFERENGEIKRIRAKKDFKSYFDISK